MNSFSQYIKIIGKGKRAGRYLTVDEAYQAFRLILCGHAQPEQIGAFLMLLRVREESVEELAGFVKACREFLNPELSAIKVDLDLGCYAGKRRHLPWFLLAVFCLANSGKKVLLHGTKEPDSNRLYLPEVFDTLNIPVSHTAEHTNTNLTHYGFAYMDLAQVSPQLDELIQMRALFGLRSPANTLARMLNPTKAKNSYHGVFHRHFDERHAEVAKLLGDNNVSCIRGEGGEVEVNPEREFNQYICRNAEVSKLTFPELLPQRQIKPRELNPSELAFVWTGEIEFEYATQAIIGTLASYISLMENDLTPKNALQQATQLWQSRDTSPLCDLWA
ncbi:MAG: glycosyl transferase family protein [Gammaproteobacteria bacterium]|nr:glycosyl transferase family protein [Gammaproteobacteria bacterium]